MFDSLSNINTRGTFSGKSIYFKLGYKNNQHVLRPAMDINNYSRFLSNSEAHTSELVENHEYMFPL